MDIGTLKVIIGYASQVLEAAGVAIIVLGIAYYIIKFVARLARGRGDSYTVLKLGVGKTILLGLEVLIAADIINTVITDPVLKQVIALGIVVLIRTFLSFSLQVELEGRLPWRKA